MKTRVFTKEELTNGEFNFLISVDTSSGDFNEDHTVMTNMLLEIEDNETGIMYEGRGGAFDCTTNLLTFPEDIELEISDEVEELINVERLEYLEDRDLMLQCLEEAGVDNWEGYGDAMDLFREYKKEK